MPRKLGFYSSAEAALRGADLTGMAAIVTGGNSGLGAETVRVLASAGADVVMCSRNTTAGQAAADEILEGLRKAAAKAGPPKRPAPGSITVVPLDLADLDSVAAFVEHPAVAGLPAIHLLVLNAGIMALPKKEVTKQGFEAQWGVNHVAHHHLTQLLLPKMKAQGASARVVVLSSIGHTFTNELPLDDLNWERRPYSSWPAYGQAKLSNALFALELARRMEKQGLPIKAYSVHPGAVNTPLSRHMSGGGGLRCVMRLLAAVPGLLGLLGGKTIAQGTSTTIYACVAPELENRSGEYLADCAVGAEVGGMWGRFACHPSALARDAQLARGLWDATEEMIRDAQSRKRAKPPVV